MKSSCQLSLKGFNSFSIDVDCPKILFPRSIEELTELVEQISEPYYILGEGSNTLFVEDTSPLVIKPDFRGIEIHERKDDFLVKAAAAENWHALVEFCVNKGISGLENLALIPGSVGAAPVQNIGAYGVELADYCHSVSWYEFSTGIHHHLTNSECRFSYRDSVFKTAYKGRGLITGICLSLPKAWQANLTYPGLNELSRTASAREVMAKVISLRQSKLPDPEELPNAGSFFKNPVVSQNRFLAIARNYPHMPSYPQGNGEVKLAAGWLIDQTGLKGCRVGEVGVHKQQALVLVNYGNAKGQELVALAKEVQKKVYDKFSINLVPEVRMVSAQGEVDFDKL